MNTTANGSHNERDSTIYLTHHAAGHALLGSPIHIGIHSFDAFHGVKIIVSANFLLMCGVKRLGTKYFRVVH